MRFPPQLVLGTLLVLSPAAAFAAVCNVKVVTDGSPDYSDLPSMIHSIASRWPTPAEKCFALFYWNHIARRQTTPMSLHGLELSDPIRQFNDYGYTMCSTIAGINCSIWHHMSLPVRYWDVKLHTVSEVFYDGRWHLYDNSLSNIFTLCDGKTVAGVEDVGKEGACALSGGRVEPSHCVKYHALFATSPNGFYQGADTMRGLADDDHYIPSVLKHRYYFFDWDAGHRYILDLREGEAYTRFYRSLGKEPRFYVPNRGKDPEEPNPRYRIRGNGVWTFRPRLTAEGLAEAVHSASNISPVAAEGIRPAEAGKPAAAVFKVQSANVTASMKIRADYALKTGEDGMKVSVSTDNGISWTEAWKSAGGGSGRASLDLIEPVSGAYETLVRIDLDARSGPGGAVLRALEIETTTQLNSKTQPRLLLGKNTVFVGRGDPSESIVLWPELQAGKYRRFAAEEKNIRSAAEHPGYMGAIYPAVPKEDAYLVFRIDAPRDLVRVTYGGRFYNRAPESHIDLLHSFDGGKTWTRSWTLTRTDPPWDEIRYETVEAPKGVRSALLKYLMNSPEASPSGASIYALRIEANHEPAASEFRPIEVTFAWNEVRKDRTLLPRSHAQLVEKVPFRYEIHVGGEDHPAMESLRVNLKGSVPGVTYGYSDGKDPGGEKFVGKWATYGRNLARGKPYEVSVPPDGGWDGTDPDRKKLTDGIVGPPYAGGPSYRWGAVWNGSRNPAITVDLGASRACASFGMNFHGYPWWDTLRGEIEDRIEVLVSEDGKEFRSLGLLPVSLWWKDIPVNHMWTDEETMCAPTCRLVPERPVTARFVRYRVESGRFFCPTEIEVLDSIRLEPFDLRLALPGDGR